ncbi:hypothetical protein GCM10011316_13720 [Roseibium aquae]|uniref:Uncharacterized protein n=1 Tax=Roseibium aquae TaxID=1323746 RepID=A0A916TI49_9HYPH|nr:hypothetical protein [Roseibium aquae]GGB43028.1 hypothetical protein GCM10011316_13720 [Roseibium aquae]
MKSPNLIRAAVISTAMALSTGSVLAAGGDEPKTTGDDVRAEVAEAMDAITSYTVDQRDKALAEAEKALARLDAEIERREQALRENWAQMSDQARQTAAERLDDLRDARNRLGERYGALEAGASEAWGELRAGFSSAWDTFSKAWSASEEEAPEEGSDI